MSNASVSRSIHASYLLSMSVYSVQALPLSLAVDEYENRHAVQNLRMPARLATSLVVASFDGECGL